MDQNQNCNCPICRILKALDASVPVVAIPAETGQPAPAQHRRHPEGEPSPAPTPTISGDAPVFSTLSSEPLTLTPEHLMALRCSLADTLFAVFRLGGYSGRTIIPVLQDFKDAGVIEGNCEFRSDRGRAYVAATLTKAGRLARDFYASKGWAL